MLARLARHGSLRNVARSPWQRKARCVKERSEGETSAWEAPTLESRLGRKKKILDSFLVIVKKRCEVCQKARWFFFRIFKLYLAAPRQGERCRFFKLIVFVDHRTQSVSTKLVSNQKFFLLNYLNVSLRLASKKECVLHTSTSQRLSFATYLLGWAEKKNFGFFPRHSEKKGVRRVKTLSDFFFIILKLHWAAPRRGWKVSFFQINSFCKS